MRFIALQIISPGNAQKGNRTRTRRYLFFCQTFFEFFEVFSAFLQISIDMEIKYIKPENLVCDKGDDCHDHICSERKLSDNVASKSRAIVTADSRFVI